jgi:hypothetical protein
LAKRPAIKAANSLAGGENFDDVLQYYQVRLGTPAVASVRLTNLPD